MRTIIVSFANASLVADVLWKLHTGRERNISTVKHKFLKSASYNTAAPVEFVIKEAHRLYPPTKSVYREFRMETNRTTDVVIADIESCRRIPSIWGINADRVDASRWKNLRAEVKEAFMPFGNAKITYPAKRVHGPMTIAVLVAALAGHVIAEKVDVRVVPCRIRDRAWVETHWGFDCWSQDLWIDDDPQQED